MNEVTKQKGKAGGLQNLFRALSSRNYRLFFTGQGVSVIGTWMQIIAMSWLVYRLTGSAFLLGIVGFASQLPIFILAPFTGVLIDRYNRQKILIITQTLAMLQAFIMAALVLTSTVTVWAIVVVSVFLGLINSFDMPARQAFVLDVVERREDLGNAIALNSSLFNGARLIGPSIGGVIIAAVGEGICFTINGATFLALIFCLLAMRLKPPKIEIKESRIWNELKEGFSYAFGSAPIRYLILLTAVVSLVGVPYTVLMPIFAADILHGDANTLGFLMAASGVGALVGTLYLAAKKSVWGLGRIVGIAAGIFGAGLILFSLSRFLALSLVWMALTGFGMIVQIAASNTILQTIADDDKRGRIMSIFTMSFIGIAPFGSLLAGGAATGIGSPNTLMIGGAICIVAAIFFFIKFRSLRDTLRSAYAQKSIFYNHPH